MDRTDIFDALAFQRRLLKKTGCWPKRQKSLQYLLRQIFSWAWDILFILTLTMELILNIKERDFIHLSETLSFYSSYASYEIKNAIFAFKAQPFLDVLDRLKSPIFKEYPYECDRHVKTTNKYAKIVMRTYHGFMCLWVIGYFLRPFCTQANLAIRFEVYPLRHWWFPFHCFQVSCVALGCWNNSCLEFTALGLISIGAAQFEILRDKLLNVRRWAGLSYEEIENGECVDTEEIREEIDRLVNERLNECVQHHNAIIQYCADIENIFCNFFLIQFADSVLATCNTMYQFELENDPLMKLFLIVYSMILLTQLAIYCFYGNNLTVRSEEIRDACYMSEWYNCGTSVRKTLFIIMERAKRPTILTAGKISYLGLNAFVTILRSAYSYYTLMNGMK